MADEIQGSFSFEEAEPASSVATAEPKAAPFFFAEAKTPEAPAAEPLTPEQHATARIAHWAEHGPTHERLKNVGTGLGGVEVSPIPDVLTNPFNPSSIHRKLPFIGGAIAAADIAPLIAAANKIKAGKGTEEDFKTIGTSIGFAREKQDEPLHKQVLDIVSNIPGFATEFGLTGGGYGAVRAGLTKALPKIALNQTGKLLIGAAAGVGGLATQVATNPALIARNTAERMRPEIAGGKGEDFLQALPKGLLDSTIEIASEHAGGLLGKIPVPQRIQALQAGIVKRWLAKKPGRTMADLYKKVAEPTGWHGVVGEVLEERVGDKARLLTGLESQDENVVGQLESGDWKNASHQLLIEGLAFAAPGTVNLAGQGISNLLSESQAATKPVPTGVETQTTTPTPPVTEGIPSVTPKPRTKEEIIADLERKMAEGDERHKVMRGKIKEDYERQKRILADLNAGGDGNIDKLPNDSNTIDVEFSKGTTNAGQVTQAAQPDGSGGPRSDEQGASISGATLPGGGQGGGEVPGQVSQPEQNTSKEKETEVNPYSSIDVRHKIWATEGPEAAANYVNKPKRTVGELPVANPEDARDSLWKDAQAIASDPNLPEIKGTIVEQAVDKAARAGLLETREDFDHLLDQLAPHADAPIKEQAKRAAEVLNQMRNPEAEQPAPSTPQASPMADLATPAPAPEKKPRKEFSSTQINLPEEIAAKVVAASKKIPEADLADDGRETEPHVTVKYGLHTNEAEHVRKLIENEPPIKAKLGKASVFPATETGGTYDVVKLDVDSPDLHRINKLISDSLPHTDTHPNYHPHVTLAYVKPGLGEKHVGMADLVGQELTVDRIIFSDKDRNHVEVVLKGRPAERSEAEIEAAEPKKSLGGKKPIVAQQPTQQSNTDTSPVEKIAAGVEDHLRRNDTLSHNDLFKLADEAFGGTRAEGKYGDSQAYDALESGINRYLRDNTNPTVDAATAKETVKALQELSIPRHRARTGNKDTLQQFSTPPAYAYAVTWAANLQPSDVVLEPSAGTGSVAIHAVNAGSQVHANEIDPERAALLSALPVKQVFTEDAEHLAAILPGKMPKPSVVVMNPPFSRAGHRMGDKMITGTDRKHIDQALEFMQPGGRLVAIIGAGLHGRGVGFDRWLADLPYTVRADVEVARNVYRGHGTEFPTRVLVIEKNPKAVDNQPVTGTADNLSSLIDMLEGVRNERTGQTTGQQPTATAVAESRPAKLAGEGKPATVGANSRGQPASQPAASEVVSGEQPTSDTAPSEPVRTPDTAGSAGNAGLGAGGSTAGAATARPERKPGKRGKQPSATSAQEQQPGSAGGKVAGKPLAEPAAKSSGAATDRQSAELGQEIHSEPTQKIKKAGELGDSTFEPYQPEITFKGAKQHPASLVESAVMAAVGSPTITYTPKLPAKLLHGYALENGDRAEISGAQMEVVAKAGQANSQVLPNGQRRGFMIGDGTGVGKAREIGGIIMDNWNQGRHKAVWISKNSSLHSAAALEWSRVGGDLDLVFQQAKLGSGEAMVADKGILFSTYSTLSKLASDTAKANGNTKSRLEQITDWLGPDFDGVIVFDESHLMGSAMDRGRGMGKKSASQMALAGVDLQEKLPNARVIYLSATSATEIENLAYATRLGLWGDGTAFSDREKFMNAISAGGVAAMEKVAADMKAMGMYAARSISFDDGTEKGTVTYDRLEHQLTPDQHRAFDKMAEAWQSVFKNMNDALELTGGKKSGSAVAAARGQFWAANQRFFNQVLTAMQTPAVIQQIENDLAAGRSAVVQLTNTNEAAQKRALADREDDEDLDTVDVSPKYILMDYLERSFPTTKYEDYMDENGNIRQRPVVDSNGNPVQDPQAVAMKEQLLDELGSLQVANRGALDMIIDHFGADAMAEVTGRSERLVEKDGKMAREKLSPRARKADVDAFMDGRKRILVFSEAGGTGAGYHSDLTRKNQQKRHHYLLQAGWRADTAIQGFGRTHRSNQAQAPKYILVHTNLKGQKRFISTIARRLSQLGAITKGQRQAGDSGVFSAADNLESTEAREALRHFYGDVMHNSIADLDLSFLEETLGLRMRDAQGNMLADLPPITQFLNRVLSLPVEKQNRVFDEFQSRLDNRVEAAKASGTLDQGMETVRADKINKKSEQTVYKHETGAEAKHVVVGLLQKTKPLDWSTSSKWRNEGYVISSQTGKVYMVQDTGQTKQTKGGNLERQKRLVGPMGMSFSSDRKLQNEQYWAETDKPTAKDLWDAEVKAVPDYAEREMHLLTGVLLPVWDRLPEGTNQVKRLRTDAGEQILGREIPANEVQKTLKKLGASVETPALSPNEAVKEVLAGSRLILANDWEIKRSRVEGENLIELKGPDYSHGAELERLGAFKRRVNYDTRWFIPTGAEAERVMGGILKSRPIAEVRKANETQEMRLPPAAIEEKKSEPESQPFREPFRYEPQENPQAIQKSNSGQQTVSNEARTPGDTKPGIAAADILKTWGRIFNVPLRIGGFSGKAAGIYKVMPEVVRQKEEHYGNLAVAAHEIAHDIDKHEGMTDALEGNPNLTEEANEIKALDYAQEGRLEEGWAEYFREYITEGEPQKSASKFTAWFEGTWLPDHPELAKQIQEARDYAQKYANQSVFQRVRSMIGKPSQDLEFSERWKEKVLSKAARLEQRWVDDLATLKNIQEEAGNRGMDYSQAAGVYDTAVAYKGSAPAHAAMALEEGVHTITEGKKLSPSLWGLKNQIKNAEEYDEAVSYAWAKHTLFMEDLRPGYNTGFPDGVDGAKVMVEYVAEDPEKLARYERVAVGIAQFNNGLLDMLVDAGALPAAERDKIIAEYGDNYFPLQRVHDTSLTPASAGRSYVNLPKPIRKRSSKGSGRAIIDPFDATVARTMYLYGRAAKARVATRLVETLDPKRGGVEGMGGLLDRIDPKNIVHKGKIEEIMKTLVDTGIVDEDDAKAMRIAAGIKFGKRVRRADSTWFADRHGIDLNDKDSGNQMMAAAEGEPDILATISLWRQDFTPNAEKATMIIPDENGKPVMYEADRFLYDTMTGQDEQTFGSFGTALRLSARVFKAGAVNLSTAFGLGNLIRDFIEYQGRASEIKGIKSILKPLQFAALYAGYKARQVAGYKTDNALLHTYEEMGGKLYTRLGSDIGSRQDIRKRKFNKQSTSAFVIDPRNWKSLALNGLESLQEAIAITDAPPRLAEMEAAANDLGFYAKGDKWVDATGNEVTLPEYARIRMANAAGNATVNFKIAGSVGRKVNEFLPFSNAAIQSVAREARLLASFKHLANRGDAQQKALRYLVYLSAAAALGAAYWRLRHDDDDYREQEDYLRQNYWTAGWNGKTYVRIPKPRDMAQIVGNVTEAMLNQLYHDDSQGAVAASLGSAVTDRLPTSGGLPRGLVEAFVSNYDYFRQRPLVPEYLQHEPKEMQFTPYTSEVSKLIGQTVGKHIGLSPIQVEHLLNSASGGMYKRFMDTGEAAVGDISDRFKPEAERAPRRLGMKHAPFVRAVLIDQHQAGSINDFYVERDKTTMRTKIDAALGSPDADTLAKKHRLDDYAELMTEIRKLDEKDLRGRRKFVYEPYLVGLAREALDRSTLEHNPSPFMQADLPEGISDLLAKFAERKAKVVYLSARQPTKAHEGDLDYEETLGKWKAGRENDLAWLQEHEESPAVAKAIQAVRRSKSFVNIRMGEKMPKMGSGPGAADKYKIAIDRWRRRIKNTSGH